jgi:hypothetical protein
MLVIPRKLLPKSLVTVDIVRRVQVIRIGVVVLDDISRRPGPPRNRNGTYAQSSINRPTNVRLEHMPDRIFNVLDVGPRSLVLPVMGHEVACIDAEGRRGGGRGARERANSLHSCEGEVVRTITFEVSVKRRWKRYLGHLRRR